MSEFLQSIKTLFKGKAQAKPSMPAKADIADFIKAAQNGNNTKVQDYIDRFGDNIVNARDSVNFTALILAAGAGNTATVDLLLLNNADIKAVNNFDNTALHDAAREGRLEVVELLLQRGADKEARNGGNSTPLIAAAWGGHTSVIETLLIAGADVHATNIDGKSAFDCACAHGYKESAALLQTWPERQRHIIATDLAALHKGTEAVIKVPPRLKLRPKRSNA